MPPIPRRRWKKADADELAALEPSIRACEATPARVILHFDGQPDAAAANDAASYRVVNTAEPNREYETNRPEYDADSQRSILRNPVKDVELGDWLQVAVSGLGGTGREITYFVRVQSELSLLTAASPARADTSHESRSKPRLELTPAWVVVSGLVAVVILGGLAMWLASTGDMQTIAAAAFGVIGSVVGAFFGVHAGLGDRERMERNREIEATKSQMLAVMVPENHMDDALDILNGTVDSP
jgi:hypothetical protein